VAQDFIAAFRNHLSIFCDALGRTAICGLFGRDDTAGLLQIRGNPRW
jgi:hypothetical protein